MLDRIVEATRDEVARRREPCRSPSSRPRSARAEEPRPFAEALTRPGHLGHRRAQAPLAVGRRDPRGRRGRRGRARLRARRRGGAVDPHRAVPLRRLARRPARGARGDAPARAAQGLHRRPLPALRVRGRRRRRDPADRRRARAATSSPSCTARRARSTSTCSSRSTTRRSSRRALEVDADVIGINNRDLGDFTRRHRAHLRAARRRPGRQDGRLGVRLLHARAARGARARRRRRRAGRRDADARAGPRGRLPRAHRRASSAL